MRIIAAFTLALALAGCTSPQREAEITAERNAIMQKTDDCLVRESIAVAPQPVDLDTAALAVLARCDYPGVLERSFIAEHPGQREFVQAEAQKLYASILDTTKRGVAMLRTKAAPRQ